VRHKDWINKSKLWTHIWRKLVYPNATIIFKTAFFRRYVGLKQIIVSSRRKFKKKSSLFCSDKLYVVTLNETLLKPSATRNYGYKFWSLLLFKYNNLNTNQCYVYYVMYILLLFWTRFHSIENARLSPNSYKI